MRLSVTILILLFVSSLLGYGCQQIASSPSLSSISGIVNFAFEEVNSQLTLRLRTQKMYGCLGYNIKSELIQSNPNTFKIDMDGILEPVSGCATAEGPAIAAIELPELNGQYHLIFEYSEKMDTYLLNVTSTEMTLTPQNVSSLTHADHLFWRRLPSNTMWVVVFDRGVKGEDNEWRPMDRLEYDEQLAQFFAELEMLSVNRFTPAQGYYTNNLFIPPWRSWHKGDEERTIIPLNNNSWYEFRWPDIRYYSYDANWEEIRALIDVYNEKDIKIRGFNWKGERVFWTKKKQ